MNRFYTNQNVNKNNNRNSNMLRHGQIKIKRTYNQLLELNHIRTNHLSTKKLKQSEGINPESLIKQNKPKIPEKMLREIEKYNSQRYSYGRNIIINPCPCDN